MSANNGRFVVVSRYQYMTRDGKVFTSWIRHKAFKTMEEAGEEIKRLKALSKPIDKTTRLGHEFEIITERGART